MTFRWTALLKVLASDEACGDCECVEALSGVQEFLVIGTRVGRSLVTCKLAEAEGELCTRS